MIADASVRLLIPKFNARGQTACAWEIVERGTLFDESHAGGLLGLPGLTARSSNRQILDAFCREQDLPMARRVLRGRQDIAELHFPRPLETALVRHARLKDKDMVQRVSGFVLFADLRGFSPWSLDASADAISELFEVVSDRVMQFQIDYPFSYWKLLGDGIMLVWEESRIPGYSCATSACGAAWELHRKYAAYRSDCEHELPEGFGIAVCGGEILRLESATFFESCLVKDYLGPVVNQSARMQSLASAGTTLVNLATKRLADPRFHKFRDVSRQLDERRSTLKGYPSSDKQIFELIP